MTRINISQVETSELFYQLPQIFFQFEKKDTNGNVIQERNPYANMRVESKVAYALLKNRFKLSKRNGWVDNNGDVYLIFTTGELGECLDCKRDKVIAIKKELADYHLLEEEETVGRANKIYLLNIERIENPDPSEIPSTRKNRPLGNSDGSEKPSTPLGNSDTSNNNLVTDTNNNIKKAPPENSNSEVYQFYEDKFGFLSPEVAEALDSFIVQSGVALTNEALYRTCRLREEKSIPNPVSYTRSILLSWKRSGYQTIEVVKKNDPFLKDLPEVPDLPPVNYNGEPFSIPVEGF